MKKEMNKRVKKNILWLLIISMLSVGIFTVLNFNKVYYVITHSWVNVFNVGELISLGDYSLSVIDYGKGESTVIIEPGLRCSKDIYYGLQILSSFSNRVINYDHAGIGKSTNSPNPRTLPYYVEELKALLKYKDLSPPYILIGHSLGGFFIRYYAYLYPEEVAGLIFLDMPHEDWFRHIRSEWSIEEQKDYFTRWNPPLDTSNACVMERLAYEANCDSIRGKEIPTNIPVLMFTGRNLPHFRRDSIGILKDTEAWVEMQTSLVKSHPLANQIIDLELGHSPHKHKPLFVQKEINRFIEKCKNREDMNSSLK